MAAIYLAVVSGISVLNEQQLSERGQHVLKALIERYIRDGVPVGSKRLVEESGLPVSAATVRNIMADLEAKGLVSTPHTSAGRVPTSQGYRLFVDNLVTVRPLEQSYVASLRNELDPNLSAPTLIEHASSLLSQLTAQAGVVTLPRRDRFTLRQVEFLPLSGDRVLVILVINEKEVENRIIHTDRVYSEDELHKAAAFINENFAGRDLDSMKESLLSALREDKDTISLLMQAMIDVASDTLDDADENADCVVAGQNKLWESDNAQSIDDLKELLDAFHYKKDILRLLNHCIGADGIRIFIGEESGYEPFEGFSLITAPYQNGNETIGVLGIIGPTRMAYESVIPVVDITARMLSAALTQQ